MAAVTDRDADPDETDDELLQEVAEEILAEVEEGDDDRHDPEYGAVLDPAWPELVAREPHPHDESWVYHVQGGPEGIDSPGGHTILLLHGVGNDGGIWSPIMPAFARHGPVVAPTITPKLLKNEAGDRAETIDPLVEHLLAVAPPPWRIVGHSMGGIVTGLLLRTMPHLIDRAVLLNSPLPDVRRRIREGDSLDRTGRALLALKTFSRISALGRPRLPRLLRGPELLVVRNALRGFVVDPGAFEARVISRAVMSTRTRDGSEFLQLTHQLPVWIDEPCTTRPVTIVLGDVDPLVPVDLLELIEQLYPEASIHVLDRCSHFAHLERPHCTLARVREAFDLL